MKNKKTILLGVLALLSVSLVGLGATMLSNSNKLDINDYVHYEAFGPNGSGKMRASVDSYSLTEDLLVKTKIEDISQLEGCNVTPTFEYSKSDGLTNGDKVKIKVKGLEDCKHIASKGFTYGVTGLVDGAQITDSELEAGLTVTFYGDNGRGSVNIETSFPDLNVSLDFKHNAQDGTLSNGDKIQVELTEQGKGNLAAEDLVLNGKGFFEYTVSGLSEVPQTFSDFSNSSKVLESLMSEIKTSGEREAEMNGATLTVKSELLYSAYTDFDKFFTYEYSGQPLTSANVGFIVQKESSKVKELMFIGFGSMGVNENTIDSDNLMLTKINFGSELSVEQVLEILLNNGFKVQ